MSTHYIPNVFAHADTIGELMHLCAHIDKLRIQQYAMSLSFWMTLLWLFHQVVRIQPVVLFFVLSHFRTVKVVFIPCRAI